MSIVALLKAEEDIREQPQKTDKLLRKLLLPFGGGEFFFNKKEVPLFLLDLTLPADNESGVNFDLRLAYAMIALARSHGAPRVMLGIKCADGFAYADVLEKSGYAQLRQMEGVELVNLRNGGSQLRTTDTALVLDSAAIYNKVLETADMIISLAKFKSGEGRLFGGALNNAALSAELPDELDFEAQQRALVDIYSLVSPDLTIVDGLRGESGFQPQQADFLLCATDAVAADATLAAVAGIDISDIEYLQLAAQYGLGIGDPGDISIFGDDLGDIMVE